MTNRMRTRSEEAIGRREFTLQSAMALLAGVVITVDGCGSKSPSTPTPVVNDVAGVISGNHDHAAPITAAQITAANAISLNIQAQATHPHTIELTQAELRSLQNKQVVTKTSTTDNGHQHTVTFTPV